MIIFSILILISCLSTIEFKFRERIVTFKNNENQHFDAYQNKETNILILLSDH